jgi:uncharacterized protein with PhoU and TrkA domain
MKAYIYIDNRNLDDEVKTLEARIEALQRRIRELEADAARLKAYETFKGQAERKFLQQ